MNYRCSLYTDIAFSSLNIVLHTTCSLLLLHVYKHGKGSKTQQVYLLNLSVSELVRNSYFLVGKTILIATGAGGEIPKVPDATRWIMNLSTETATISSMILITADRLAAALLDLRYNNIFTLPRVKVAIFCAWGCSLIIMPMIFGILYSVYGGRVMKRTIKHEGFYIFPVLYMLYFFFAVSTYIIIFVLFVRSHRRSISSRQSIFYMFKHSKFYVAVLLISSFLLFLVIPQLIFTAMMLSDTKDSTILYILLVLTCLSDTFDGIIYFLFYTGMSQI